MEIGMTGAERSGATVGSAVTAARADRLAQMDAHIRIIPDFPQPGIAFRDITPLIADPRCFADAVAMLAEAARPLRPDVIVAVEARGFLFGGPLALALGIGLVPVRKAGKLPGAVHGVDYGLEYGRDRMEIHIDALPGHGEDGAQGGSGARGGARVLLLDDLLATGGTVAAAAELIAKVGGQIVGALFLIELVGLGGRERLEASGITTQALLTY
jgi:adenine phosphoribosyltransferase